ncbi:MAG: cupin domain-containing protein [Silanimonas sp.]
MSDDTSASPAAVDTRNAEHYRWGGDCDGWHLARSTGLSVIEERVPPGGSEVSHVHDRAEQFFYILSGQAAMVLDTGTVKLAAGQGLHVPAGMVHRFTNPGEHEVRFLVVSSPPTTGDRRNRP